MKPKPAYRKSVCSTSRLPPRVLTALKKLQKSGSEKVWFVQTRRGGSHNAWDFHPAAFHWRNEARALAVRLATPQNDDWRIIRWISDERRQRQETLWRQRYDRYHPVLPKQPTKEQIERQEWRAAKQEVRQAQLNLKAAKKRLVEAQEVVSRLYRNRTLELN